MRLKRTVGLLTNELLTNMNEASRIENIFIKKVKIINSEIFSDGGLLLELRGQEEVPRLLYGIISYPLTKTRL